jgi:hypothetical protein
MPNICITAVFDQRFCNSKLLALHGGPQRTVSALVSHVWIGAIFTKRVDYRLEAMADSQLQS